MYRPRTLCAAFQCSRPPLAFPKIEIAQYWHDRVHRDTGNQWIRNVVRDLFCKPN
ncbi:MAG TPA: hypothetical protein VF534_33220 [Paraburkholderia sp.]